MPGRRPGRPSHRTRAVSVAGLLNDWGVGRGSGTLPHPLLQAQPIGPEASRKSRYRRALKRLEALGLEAAWEELQRLFDEGAWKDPIYTDAFCKAAARVIAHSSWWADHVATLGISPEHLNADELEELRACLAELSPRPSELNERLGCVLLSLWRGRVKDQRYPVEEAGYHLRRLGHKVGLSGPARSTTSELALVREAMGDSVLSWSASIGLVKGAAERQVDERELSLLRVLGVTPTASDIVLAEVEPGSGRITYHLRDPDADRPVCDPGLETQTADFGVWADHPDDRCDKCWKRCPYERSHPELSMRALKPYGNERFNEEILVPIAGELQPWLTSRVKELDGFEPASPPELERLGWEVKRILDEAEARIAKERPRLIARVVARWLVGYGPEKIWRALQVPEDRWFRHLAGDGKLPRPNTADLEQILSEALTASDDEPALLLGRSASGLLRRLVDGQESANGSSA